MLFLVKKQKLKFLVKKHCDTCNGSGCKKGTKPETCSHCHGTGQLNVEQNTPFGKIVNRRVCNYCNGTGKEIKHKCSTCGGAGKVKKRHKISVKIPAGIDDGQQLRVAGQGEPGINGGPSGDLYVVFHVRHMSFLNVMGMMFIVKCQSHLFKLHLEMKLKSQLLHGKVKLKVPAGTQTGTKFRLRGKGIPNVRGRGIGDQHIIVKVVTPTKLTEKQKQLLQEFAEISGHCPKVNKKKVFLIK